MIQISQARPQRCREKGMTKYTLGVAALLALTGCGTLPAEAQPQAQPQVEMVRVAAAVSPTTTTVPPTTTTTVPPTTTVVVRIEAADTSLQPAVRLNPPVVVAQIDPPVPGGLNGLPFAPYGLSNCDEMNFYRVQWGLPGAFAGLGWRESNCRNDVRTWCCYGYWQNFISSHLRGSYRDRIINECLVTGVSDIFGLAPLQKQKQTCVTKVVYDISGFRPWST